MKLNVGTLFQQSWRTYLPWWCLFQQTWSTYLRYWCFVSACRHEVLTFYVGVLFQQIWSTYLLCWCFVSADMNYLPSMLVFCFSRHEVLTFYVVVLFRSRHEVLTFYVVVLFQQTRGTYTFYVGVLFQQTWSTYLLCCCFVSADMKYLPSMWPYPFPGMLYPDQPREKSEETSPLDLTSGIHGDLAESGGGERGDDRGQTPSPVELKVPQIPTKIKYVLGKAFWYRVSTSCCVVTFVVMVFSPSQLLWGLTVNAGWVFPKILNQVWALTKVWVWVCLYWYFITVGNFTVELSQLDAGTK